MRPYDIALFVAAVLAVGASLAMLPSTWREYRWAKREGSYDEQRIGRGVWWGAVAAVLATGQFTVYSFRLVLVPVEMMERVAMVYTSATIAFAACLAYLVSYTHFVKRRDVVAPPKHQEADAPEDAGPVDLHSTG